MSKIDIQINPTSVGNFASSKIQQATSINDTLNGKVDDLEGTAEATLSEITSLLENTMNQMLSKGTQSAMDAIGLSENNLELAQTIVNTTSNIASNISSIISILPTSVTTIPSESTPLDILSTSLLEIEKEQINSMKMIYDEGKTAVMMLYDNYEEILLESAIYIIQKIIELVDLQCYKYTGYHILEIYYMCSKGFNLIKQLFKKHKSKEDGSVEGSGHAMDKATLKKELMAWLAQQSDAIYNAFLMISIKDIIVEVQDTIQRLANMDVKLLADEIDNLDDFVDFLDSLGIDGSNKGLTINDIQNLGLNAVLSTANALNTIVSNASSLATMDNAVSVGKTIASNVKQTYEMKSEVTDNDTQVYVTLHCDPASNGVLDDIQKTLEKIKVDDANVFDTSNIMSVRNFIEEQYQSYQDNTFDKENLLQVIGKKNGFPTMYVFHIAIDVTMGNQQEDSASIFPTKKDLQSDLEVEVDDEETKRNTFDILYTLVNTLKPILPIMKTIGTLVSNYKTNKAKVKAHAHADAAVALLRVMDKVMGLQKSINTQDYNFYTIRTHNLYEACRGKLDIYHPNKDGMAIINAQGTQTLCDILKENNIVCSNIDTSKNTYVYIDAENVNQTASKDTKLKDGTTNHLDNICVVADKQTILYSEGNKSVYASEILQAISKGYDAYS